jgi:molybdopterin synthase catalytic subunit
VGDVITARLYFHPFVPSKELERLDAWLTAGEAGALVTFSGHARSRAKNGAEVRSLTLQHHPRLTQPSLERIATDAAERFDVQAVDVVHRAGLILPGEAIVWVAAASAHRRAAFEAADYMMDRLKTEAIFWKREETTDGSVWIDPTDVDYADVQRWGEGRHAGPN